MPSVTARNVLIAAAGSIILLATLGLWARYGETIFTDIVLAALGGCFY